MAPVSPAVIESFSKEPLPLGPGQRGSPRSDTEGTLEGTLEVRSSGVVGRWTPYHFVLEHGTLSRYALNPEGAPEELPEAVISASDLSKLELRDAKDARRELCIAVASPSYKTFRLRAELPEEAHAWLQALEAARVSARPRAAPAAQARGHSGVEVAQGTPLNSPTRLTASTATPRSQAVWSPLPSTRGGRSEDLADPQATAGSRRAWRPAGASRLDGIAQADARLGGSRPSSPRTPRSQASPSPRSRSVSPRCLTPRLQEMHSLHHRKHQVFDERRSCQEKEERSRWQQDYEAVMARTKSPRNQSSLEETSSRLYEDHLARTAGREEMRRKVQQEHDQQVEATRFRRPASAANISPRGTSKAFAERTQEDAERRRAKREEADQRVRPRSVTGRARSVSPAPSCSPRIAELYEDKARKARQQRLELDAKNELDKQHSFRPELKAKPGIKQRPGLEARLEEMHREHGERLKRNTELAAKEQERRQEEAIALGTPSPRQTTPRRRATTPRGGLPDVVSLSMTMHGLDLALLTDAFNRRLHGAVSEAVRSALLSEAPPGAAQAAAKVSFAAAPRHGGGVGGRGRADLASSLACQLQAEIMPPSEITATAVAARLRASSCLGEAVAAAVKAVPGLTAVGFRSEVFVSEVRVATVPVQEPWPEGDLASGRQLQGGATSSRCSRPSTPQGRAGARSVSPAPATRADHLVAAFAASVQQRCPLDPPLAPSALRGLVAPLNDAMEAHRQAARECQHSEGFTALCQMSSQRLLTDGAGRRRLVKLESWPSGVEPGPICQAEESLDELLATAAEAQHLLQEAVSPSRDDQPWLPGEVRQRPKKVPTALFAYSSGPKPRAAAENKALVLYGPAEGQRRYRHLLDLARLTLVFSTCDLLQAGLQLLMERLEVVHVRNYFESPNQMGAKYIEVLVVVDVQKPGGHTVPHVCELRLEETCFWQAHQVAAPHLEQLVAQVHQLYGSECRGMEDSVAYMARATLTATQTSQSLRFLRRRLAARFGSTVSGWRRALGTGGRLLTFARLRDACKTLRCQDQVIEYWSELDASYGGCISLFELDPEGTALLARFRARLLTSAGGGDSAEMHKQLAVLGQAREGSQLSAAEFRAAARALGYSATDSERLFVHLDCKGGGQNEEPGWVTAAEVAWLKRLPQLVDLGALALAPGEPAGGSPRGGRPAAGSRPQLVSGLFNLLDNAALSGTGAFDCPGLGAGAVPPQRLGPAQLRRYACLCGFEGTDEEWGEEFQAICERYEWNASIGADARQFSQLVDDLEGGGYCPTEKLHDMLAGVALVDTASSPCARVGSWHSYRYEHRSRQVAMRGRLINGVFQALDKTNQGRLLDAQLRRLASAAGFAGGGDEWAQEAQAMCHVYGWNLSKGVDEFQFEAFVNDGRVVSWTDQELEGLRSRLASPASAGAPGAAEASLWRAHLGAGAAAGLGAWGDGRPPGCPQGQAAGQREILTATLFHELDAQGAGLLGPKQVRRFAELCGFSGGDRRWAEEWKAMCHTFEWNPSQGMDLCRFTQLVDSDLVVYSDDDLQDLLSLLDLQAAAGTPGRAAAGGDGRRASAGDGTAPPPLAGSEAVRGSLARSLTPSRRASVAGSAGAPAAGSAGPRRGSVSSRGSNQKSCFDWKVGGDAQ